MPDAKPHPAIVTEKPLARVRDMCDRPATVTRYVWERRGWVAHAHPINLCAACTAEYDRRGK